MKKNRITISLTAACMIVFASCTGSKQNAEQAAQDSTEIASVEVSQVPEYIGIYEGTLPCADCPGIKTTLEIKDDQTYNLRSEYLEKKDGVFEDSGVYNLIDGKLIELVTPSTGGKLYYKIGEATLLMSDSLGTVNEGELAQSYILKKQ